MKSTQYVLMLALSIISGFLGGALSVWFLMPQSVLAQDEPPKVVEAQEFRVVDANGILRGYFSLDGVSVIGRTDTDDPHGIASLKVDSDGTPAVTLSGVDDMSAILKVSDFSKGVGGQDEGGPQLLLSDLHEEGRFIFVGLTKTAAQFITIDSKGNQVTLGLVGETPRLRLDREPWEEKGGHGILMEAVPERSMLAMVNDNKFTTRLEDALLSLYDDEERPRAVLGTTQLKHPDTGSTEIRAPSSLVLFDEEGKVVWSAP